MNNLLVIGMEQNSCQLSDIEAFDRLPFPRKLMFTSKDLPLDSNVYMPEFADKGEVGDPYRKGHVFYRHLLDKLKKT